MYITEKEIKPEAPYVELIIEGDPGDAWEGGINGRFYRISRVPVRVPLSAKLIYSNARERCCRNRYTTTIRRKAASASTLRKRGRNHDIARDYRSRAVAVRQEATLPRLTSESKLTVFVNDAIRDIATAFPLIRTESARIVGTTVDLSQLDRHCMKVVGVSQEGSAELFCK